MLSRSPVAGADLFIKQRKSLFVFLQGHPEYDPGSLLREYQRDAFGETTAVELPGKDLVAVAAAYGVPVREATPEDLGAQLAWAFSVSGPAVVVLRALLTAAAATR